MNTTIDPQSLAHHLRIAAERYDADAATFSEPGTPHEDSSVGHTFRYQATQARQWADAFESANNCRRDECGRLVVFHD